MKLKMLMMMGLLLSEAGEADGGGGGGSSGGSTSSGSSAGPAAPAQSGGQPPATGANDQADRELAELREYKAKIEAEKRQKAEDEAKRKGEYEKLIQAEKERTAKLEADKKRLEDAERERKMMDAVLEGAPAEHHKQIRGLVLVELDGKPRAPEKPGEAGKALREKIAKEHPNLFAPAGPAVRQGAPNLYGQPAGQVLGGQQQQNWAQSSYAGSRP